MRYIHFLNSVLTLEIEGWVTSGRNASFALLGMEHEDPKQNIKERGLWAFSQPKDESDSNCTIVILPDRIKLDEGPCLEKMPRRALPGEDAPGEQAWEGEQQEPAQAPGRQEAEQGAKYHEENQGPDAGHTERGRKVHRGFPPDREQALCPFHDCCVRSCRL